MDLNKGLHTLVQSSLVSKTGSQTEVTEELSPVIISVDVPKPAWHERSDGGCCCGVCCKAAPSSMLTIPKCPNHRCWEVWDVPH